MAISKVVVEVSQIIKELEFELGRKATQQEISDRVLHVRGGDRSCSNATIVKARKYLDSVDAFDSDHDPRIVDFGLSVLNLVTAFSHAAGGTSALLLEVEAKRKEIEKLDSRLRSIEKRVKELNIDDKLLEILLRRKANDRF